MIVIGGSVPLAGDDPARVRSACLVYGPDGARIARYDKMHLFRYADGDENYDEARTIAPGERVVTFDAACGRVGLSICYDLRFPELYRSLTVQGATILFVPAAFRFETGVDHWEPLLRARAIEDQAFVIAAAQWGSWGPQGRERRNFGHSLVADPWGRVIAEAPDGVGVTLAELDLTEVGRVREMLPALRHRRLFPSC